MPAVRLRAQISDPALPSATHRRPSATLHLLSGGLTPHPSTPHPSMGRLMQASDITMNGSQRKKTGYSSWTRPKCWATNHYRWKQIFVSIYNGFYRENETF